MQDIIEFRSDMEESLSWRIKEVVDLKNVLRDDNKVPVVKTLVVMLYAHFEGFFKDCMECYIHYVNSSEIKLKMFTDAIIAASLNKEYAAFEDRNRKCRELISQPPVEDYLHKFHRRKELTQKFMSNYLEKKIRINEKIINTKSNLNYEVLQENLYILGLDYNYFQSRQNNINKLVRVRNGVAHGSQKEPIELDEYEILQDDIVETMEMLIVYLYEFCEDERYLRNN